MIVRTLYVIAWDNAQISDALNILATAGQGIKYAYFYADRVIMRARPLKDTRGVLSRVSIDELTTDALYDVINRVHTEIYNALSRAVAAMNEELPAGAE